MKHAAARQKWANMSNYVRLHALTGEGGIYLDTDVEVIKSFDDLLSVPAFVGCESRRPKINNAVCGSVSGHPFFKRMISLIENRFHGSEKANLTAPELLTYLLKEHGYTEYSEHAQNIANVMVFPTRYFYPFHFSESLTPQCITPDTYTIHYWDKRW